MTTPTHARRIRHARQSTRHRTRLHVSEPAGCAASNALPSRKSVLSLVAPAPGPGVSVQRCFLRARVVLNGVFSAIESRRAILERVRQIVSIGPQAGAGHASAPAMLSANQARRPV